MKPRSSRMLLILLSIIVAGLVWMIDMPAQSAAQGLGTASEKQIDFDLLGMSVDDVLKILSDTGGWTIIPSPKVSGKVSLWSKGATPSQILDKLCLVRDYMYRREGNLIYIMTRDEFEQRFGRVQKSFRLKHLKAANIQSLLKDSLTKNGKLSIDEWTNTVVISDTPENIQKLEKLLAELDQGVVRRVFQLNQAKASEVAKTLNKMFPKEGPFEADDRANQIVAINTKLNVDKVAEIIAQLDQEIITRVFQLRFEKASAVAGQLAELVSSPKNIKAYDDTNQIVVTDVRSRVEHIARVLEELDSRVVTETIQLRYAHGEKLVNQLSSLVSGSGNITVDLQTNQLIIEDNDRNVDRIRQLVAKLDQPITTEVITLHYALASDIVRELAGMIHNSEGFRADERTNQIIISETPDQIRRIVDIVKLLDKEDSFFTRTYTLRYARAQKVAEVLRQFLVREATQRRGTDQAEQQVELQSVPKSGGVTSGEQKPVTLPAGVSLGSGPGLEGVQPPSPSPQTQSAVAPSAPSKVSPYASDLAQGSAEGLGPVGMVVADSRSNTVTVTETLSNLSKIEQLLEKLDVEIPTFSYQVKYREFEELGLEGKLANLLSDPQDSYQLDPATKMVSFTTIPARAERVLELLEQWDRRPPQVLIEATIMSVNKQTLKDLGIDASAIIAGGGLSVNLDSSFPPEAAGSVSGSAQVQRLSGNVQFDVLIRAVENDSRSKVLASPRIMAIDGREAEVRMARDEPFTETSIDSDSGRVIENVRFLQVGTILRVRPIVKDNGLIELTVSMDVSNLVEIRNGTPVVDRNTATSTILVKDGHHLLIGGLLIKRNISSVDKVPLLGDIPILNILFRREHQEVVENELILLLKPRIVAPDESIDGQVPVDWQTVVPDSLPYSRK